MKISIHHQMPVITETYGHYGCVIATIKGLVVRRDYFNNRPPRTFLNDVRVINDNSPYLNKRFDKFARMSNWHQLGWLT